MPSHDWTSVPAGLFHDFHQSWSIRIKDALNAGRLPDDWVALVEQRSGPRETDVLTIDERPRDSGTDSPKGGALLLDRPMTRFVRRSAREHYAGRANRVLVQHTLGRTAAVIEIVSPGNKHDKRSFREFLDKSLDFLRAGVHLLIVDLFPPTRRDPHGIHRAIWDEFADDDLPFELPPGQDRVLASYQAGDETTAFVEVVALGEPLPDMPLFLFDDHYVRVPLEDTYRQTWAAVPASLRRLVESPRP